MFQKARCVLKSMKKYLQIKNGVAYCLFVNPDQVRVFCFQVVSDARVEVGGEVAKVAFVLQLVAVVVPHVNFKLFPSRTFGWTELTTFDDDGDDSFFDVVDKIGQIFGVAWVMRFETSARFDIQHSLLHLLSRI